MKSAKSVRKTTKPASNRQPPTKMGRNKLNAKLSSATTASTSSTNSSSSSTCQLIPMKLNNGSVGTASTTVGNCLVNCPASPMVDLKQRSKKYEKIKSTLQINSYRYYQQ